MIQIASADPKKSKRELSLECAGGLSFSNISQDAQRITFIEKTEPTQAKLNGMKECKRNIGKFLCYHANSETMINIPLDIDSKKKGDTVIVFVNSDADDVTGNGVGQSCVVK